MKQSPMMTGVVCASLALGLSGCIEEPDLGGPGPSGEPTAQVEAALNTDQKEQIVYDVKVALYPDNFTTAGKWANDAAMYAELNAAGGTVEQIRQQVTNHVDQMKVASRGMLQPQFDGGVRIVRGTINFDAPTTDGGWYMPSGADVNTILNNSTTGFGGHIPSFAYFEWKNAPDGGSYPTANLKHPNGLVTMVTKNPSYHGVLTHEFIHVLEDRFDKANSYYMAMVGGDALGLDSSGNSAYDSCITTPAARKNSNPSHPDYHKLDWEGTELIRNILSNDKNCNGNVVNFCPLYSGLGKLGNFTSDLCPATNSVLSPGVPHTWVRNASMADANWLYLEWDYLSGSSTTKIDVSFLNSYGNPLATLSRTEAGASDRGDFRYTYIHKNDMCAQMRNAGLQGGAWPMRASLYPTTNTVSTVANYQQNHRKNVTGTVSCNYALDTATTTTLTARGGTGGTASTLSCPAGKVAVGLISRAATYVDAVGLLCGTLNANGTFSSITSHGPTGGGGGTYYAEYCPSGQALVGISGRGASWLDQIGGHCANVVSWGPSSYVNTSLLSHGGSGGTLFSDTCPAGQVITSLNLRAATLVDRVQGKCTRVVVQ
ncbi:hypothetical protein P2318_29960 [Myxococcaceae bacterium GXIMD 01537]